jgi:uncharacterized membrane protein YgcG
MVTTPTLKMLIFENASVQFLEENPFRSISQGLHTRKVLKTLSPEEKKVLGQFVRDKEFIKRAEAYHIRGPNRSRKNATAQMEKYVRDRIENKELADKILQVTQDPKFDVARNRVMTKLIVPKDTLPKTDEPLRLTPSAQKTSDQAAAREEKARLKRAEKEKVARREQRKQSRLRTELKKWITSTKIKNPNTGRLIQMRTALNADPNSELYKSAFALYAAQAVSLGLPEPRADTNPSYTAVAARMKKQNSRYSSPNLGGHRKSFSSSGVSGSQFGSGGSSGFRFGGGGGFSGGGSAGSF